MSIIPLDIQRRCERRWAARFFQPPISRSDRFRQPERERSDDAIAPHGSSSATDAHLPTVISSRAAT
jgi:hypothetical protein